MESCILYFTAAFSTRLQNRQLAKRSWSQVDASLHCTTLHLTEKRITISWEYFILSYYLGNYKFNSMHVLYFVAVNGGWSEWGAWDFCWECLRFRQRTCTNPPPRYTGKYCTGRYSEMGGCCNGTYRCLFIPCYDFFEIVLVGKEAGIFLS